MPPKTKPWNQSLPCVASDETIYTDYKDHNKNEPCSIKFKPQELKNGYLKSKVNIILMVIFKMTESLSSKFMVLKISQSSVTPQLV